MMFHWLCSFGVAGLYVLKIILSFSGAGLYGLPLFVVCIGYGDKMLYVRIIKTEFL